MTIQNTGRRSARPVVHTTGADRTRDNDAPIRTVCGEDALRTMSDDVIASILKSYADWQVIQVGGECDKPLGGHSIDLRGKTDYSETAREIASAARFIGVNFGPNAHCELLSPGR